MNKDEPKVVFIPANYKTGTSFLGFEIKTSNVLQGILLALIPVVICYAILPEFIEIKFLDTLSPVTFFSAGLGYLGVVGINGQTLGDYVSDWLSYRKNTRKTYYNPRIKKEAVFFLDEQKQDKEMLPREKIMALYSKYKAHSDLKNRELAHELEKEFEQSEELYFEDDSGFVMKPIEYMTAKERRKYEKEQRKLHRKAVRLSKGKEKKAYGKKDKPRKIAGL